MASPSGGGPAGLDLAAVRRAWPDVLAKIFTLRRTTWTFLSDHAQVVDYDGRRLVLGISTVGLANAFRAGVHADIVRQALVDVLGLDVRVEGVVAGEPGSGPSASTPPGGGSPGPGPGGSPSGSSAASGGGPSGRGPSSRPGSDSSGGPASNAGHGSSARPGSSAGPASNAGRSAGLSSSADSSGSVDLSRSAESHSSAGLNSSADTGPDPHRADRAGGADRAGEAGGGGLADLAGRAAATRGPSWDDSGSSWGSAPVSAPPSWASPGDDEVGPGVGSGGASGAVSNDAKAGSDPAGSGAATRSEAGYPGRQGGPSGADGDAHGHTSPIETSPRERRSPDIDPWSDPPPTTHPAAPGGAAGHPWPGLIENDEDLISDDDEDLTDLGEVGQPVVERLLGGKVIWSESSDD